MTTAMMVDDGCWEVRECRSNGGGNGACSAVLVGQILATRHRIVLDRRCRVDLEILAYFPSLIVLIALVTASGEGTAEAPAKAMLPPPLLLANVKLYLINHLLSTILSGQCFVLSFHAML
jgi:hypothetical protein